MQKNFFKFNFLFSSLLWLLFIDEDDKASDNFEHFCSTHSNWFHVRVRINWEIWNFPRLGPQQYTVPLLSLMCSFHWHLLFFADRCLVEDEQSIQTALNRILDLSLKVLWYSPKWRQMLLLSDSPSPGLDDEIWTPFVLPVANLFCFFLYPCHFHQDFYPYNYVSYSFSCLLSFPIIFFF